jgi:hypothetical protein
MRVKVESEKERMEFDQETKRRKEVERERIDKESD